LKLRLGANEYEKRHKIYLNSIREVNADFFIVHAKTATQESRELEDSSVYPECVEAASGKPIIANGGINSSEKVKQVKAMGVSGAMIGRAALMNPAIFDVIRNELGYNDPPTLIPSIKNLKLEYQRLHSEFGNQEVYSERFHSVVGKILKQEF
jgi:tRNA-dihydrouridine synthase